jgi:hypothetical protein
MLWLFFCFEMLTSALISRVVTVLPKKYCWLCLPILQLWYVCHCVTLLNYVGQWCEMFRFLACFLYSPAVHFLLAEHTQHCMCVSATGQCLVCKTSKWVIWLAYGFGLSVGIGGGQGSLALISKKVGKDFGGLFSWHKALIESQELFKLMCSLKFVLFMVFFSILFGDDNAWIQ